MATTKEKTPTIKCIKCSPQGRGGPSVPRFPPIHQTTSGNWITFKHESTQISADIGFSSASVNCWRLHLNLCVTGCAPFPSYSRSGLVRLPSGFPKKVEGGSAAIGLLHNGQPGKESGGLWQWDRGMCTAIVWHVMLRYLRWNGAVCAERFAETGSGAVSLQASWRYLGG